MTWSKAARDAAIAARQAKAKGKTTHTAAVRRVAATIGRESMVMRPKEPPKTDAQMRADAKRLTALRSEAAHQKRMKAEYAKQQKRDTYATKRTKAGKTYAPSYKGYSGPPRTS